MTAGQLQILIIFQIYHDYSYVLFSKGGERVAHAMFVLTVLMMLFFFPPSRLQNIRIAAMDT